MPCVWTLFDKLIDESLCSCLKKSSTVWTGLYLNRTRHSDQSGLFAGGGVTCLAMVAPFHCEIFTQIEVHYGEQLDTTSSVLTYDNRTANLCPGGSSSGRPWMSVHTADLLSHSPVWTYASVADDSAVGNRISVIGVSTKRNPSAQYKDISSSYFFNQNTTK